MIKRRKVASSIVGETHSVKRLGCYPVLILVSCLSLYFKVYWRAVSSTFSLILITYNPLTTSESPIRYLLILAKKKCACTFKASYLYSK